MDLFSGKILFVDPGQTCLFVEFTDFYLAVQNLTEVLFFLYFRYRLAYSSNFTNILDAIVQNNYQLFMLECLVLAGAKTIVKSFQEEPSNLALTDDQKKNLRGWQIPVYTFNETSPS